jgi:hypothetical protein
MAEEPLHVITKHPSTFQPVSTAAMNKRVQEAATTYASYAPIPRVAFYDVAYPSTREEAEKLKGFAVLLLTALSQQASELPPKAAYIMIRDKRVNLRLLTSARSFVPGKDRQVAKTFGSHRSDSLYLLPLQSATEHGTLLIDYAAGRDGFKLGEFEEPPADVLPKSLVNFSLEGDPPSSILEAFIRREYPRFLGE